MSGTREDYYDMLRKNEAIRGVSCWPQIMKALSIATSFRSAVPLLSLTLRHRALHVSLSMRFTHLPLCMPTLLHRDILRA